MLTRGLTLATVERCGLVMKGRGRAEGSNKGRIFLVTLMLTRGLTLKAEYF